MTKFIINGGKPLRGAVRLGGAKNASFKLMIASLLGETESRLLNLSHIGDVSMTAETMTLLGQKSFWCGERTLFIKPKPFSTSTIPAVNGKSRGATLFGAVLLANTGKAIIPVPKGCYLGARPIDRHIESFKSLGVQVEDREDSIVLTVDNLHGNTYRFPKKTHTGTEAFIMLAVKAKGQTIIVNAGQEPEIDDLISFLNKMGAKIKRAPSDKIIIDGVPKLSGAIHRVMSDRNEAVSYACAALATKGDIVIENANADHLAKFLQKINEIGGKFEVADYGIRFWYENKLRSTDIKTAPEPGFMTDWQPLWSILMTQTQGESQVIEAVYSSRLQFVDQLNKMGADITLFNPIVENPQEYFEFPDIDMDNNFYAAKINGPTPLRAMDFEVNNIREGASMTIAALIAQGQSTITAGIYHIDRGYEDLDGRLRQLGADIERKN